MEKEKEKQYLSYEIDSIHSKCDAILRQLGQESIFLSQKESAQKKFCNFIRDFGITSVAHLDFNYRNFRYFKSIKNEELSNLLFSHMSKWYGSVNNEKKLYLVAQPFRTMKFDSIHNVLDFLLEEKSLLDFCKSHGHHITIDFDNNYNWIDDGAFLLIISLQTEGRASDCLEIKLIDWGIQSVYRYE